MPIVGSHMLLYSTQPEALRALLRDAFGLHWVDAHDGWLIFALPPAELAVHPGEGPTFESGTRHEISFMCRDLTATMAELASKGVRFEGQPQQQSYGTIVTMWLPGDVRVALYESTHKTAIPLSSLH